MDEEVEIILQQDSVEVTEPLVADYILPTATANTLGGVKIGDNINIDSSGSISVPIASVSSAGVIKVGTGLAISSDGTLSATGDGYTLPQATKNTLGGVYVDDELNTLSQNPVQNAVVSLALDEIDDTVTGLQSTVGGLDDAVDGLSDDVNTVTSDLSTLSTTVGTLSTSVDTLSSTVSTQGGLITGLEDAQTATGNALTQLQGNVDPVLVNDNINVPANDVDSQAWTSGSLDIYRRGKVGVLNAILFGSKTLANGDSVILHTLIDDNIPTYETYGNLWTDAGLMNVTISTSGNIIMQNLTGTSVTITKLIGSLPIVFL